MNTGLDISSKSILFSQRLLEKEDRSALLGSLLDLASDQGVAALRLQGFTDQELFELRRLATVYRTGNGTVKDLQSLRKIADKLDHRNE